MNIIETQNLTKYYGKARGILNLNLTVEEGEFFGFIGPNGAGKSTTIRTLLGLMRPSSGKALLFGQDSLGSRQQALGQIGFLPSEAMFYPGMRVKEILRFSAELHRQNCREEARQLCQRLQLDENKKIQELSLGNRKKVGIVCALQHKPRLYILDEPTSGLDPLMQREFFTLLEERSREGATIFLSSHVLSEIQRHCTRAGIIREGRLIACDKVSELSKTNARRVTIHGFADITQLKGIRDLQKLSHGISFLYSGNIQELLTVLSQAPLTEVTIAEPDLEEIFLHYYTEGGTEHDHF